MKNLLHRTKKYFYLKKKNLYFKNSYHYKKIMILCFFGRNNVSNSARFLFGGNFKPPTIFRNDSSNFIVSFSKNISFYLWETVSGRMIRNIIIPRGFPKRIICRFIFNRIITITIKNLLIHTFNNGSLFYSLSIESAPQTFIQIMKDYSQIIIFTESGGFYFLDYMKGYLIKKICIMGLTFFSDAIFNRSEKYCLKNFNSIYISNLSGIKNNYYLTQNCILGNENLRPKKIIFNAFFKYVSYFCILLLNKNNYLWEINTGLLIYD